MIGWLFPILRQLRGGSGGALGSHSESRHVSLIHSISITACSFRNIPANIIAEFSCISKGGSHVLLPSCSRRKKSNGRFSARVLSIFLFVDMTRHDAARDPTYRSSVWNPSTEFITSFQRRALSVFLLLTDVPSICIIYHRYLSPA